MTIGTLARLGGVALDARAARPHTAIARAAAASWIAGNLLAARGVRVPDSMPRPPHRFDVDARELDDLLAAIAADPALIDAHSLPLPWRIALAAAGVPVLDRPADAALAEGASVARWRAPHA